MDLFGPTNIRSIDQKYYSLVVTDDFSRFTWTFYLGLSACFLSQLEPTSIAKSLEDPDWVDAMQEEMQQFINQQ
ncbi:hypothetical protein Tco_0460521, partial [Tanacetum coccineum]